MVDIVEIMTHWYAGRSQHEIATSLGVDRKTVRRYTKAATEAGLSPGGVASQRWCKRPRTQAPA